jgi:virulence-associated protein VapD
MKKIQDFFNANQNEETTGIDFLLDVQGHTYLSEENISEMFKVQRAEAREMMDSISPDFLDKEGDISDIRDLNIEQAEDFMKEFVEFLIAIEGCNAAKERKEWIEKFNG